MKRWIVAVCLLQCAAQVQAKDYGHYETWKVVAFSVTDLGNQSASINVVYLDQILDDLGSHAGIWPPQFDSKPDRQRAERDIRVLGSLFDSLLDRFSNNPGILLRLGVINGYGHNLGIDGASKRAVLYFDQALRLTPDSPQANFRYGQFLAVTVERAKAVPYLERAKALGVQNAAYWLGVTYSSLGERSKAIDNLRTYTTHAPTDLNAARLLDVVQGARTRQ